MTKANYLMNITQELLKTSSLPPKLTNKRLKK